MDLRQLTPAIAVAPQITPEDVAEAARMGFRTLIDNRPDEEITPDLHSDRMRAVAEAAGMAFYHLPYYPGEMTPELVAEFERVMAEVETPVLAYCRSGTRSSHLWAMSQAGQMPIEEIVSRAAKWGYDHSALVPLLIHHGKR
ncbi:TIGR01244 family sulfur transferase [Pseudothioclava arenosa]|uniref:TIGR01244 family phosphatase n=1 Tax=Pseudothioclava arenosa TaxID=1795308 RepID=A0A2A4CNN9_9RHOB|nr:TIGR01244 family sulfur transferase [Pseudothioclava arenosa]PCD76851.1 TIGR01244 family phosphatase [Pseudothioclava arenosa]